MQADQAVQAKRDRPWKDKAKINIQIFECLVLKMTHSKKEMFHPEERVPIEA